MMKSILLATIALVMMGGSAQTQTLTSSGPITVTTAGTVIENLRITANGQRCITVNNAPDVILRNIECRHVNEAGVKAFNADRLQITNFNSIHTGTASPNPSSGEIGIYVESSDDVAITRIVLGATVAEFCSIKAIVLESLSSRGITTVDHSRAVAWSNSTTARMVQ
jgi:Right handed beta helix region